MLNLIKSEEKKTGSSKIVPQYPSLIVLIKLLSYLHLKYVYISFLSRKLHISSLMLFAFNFPPKAILFKE